MGRRRLGCPRQTRGHQRIDVGAHLGVSVFVSANAPSSCSLILHALARRLYLLFRTLLHSLLVDVNFKDVFDSLLQVRLASNTGVTR